MTMLMSDITCMAMMTMIRFNPVVRTVVSSSDAGSCPRSRMISSTVPVVWRRTLNERFWFVEFNGGLAKFLWSDSGVNT